jgi:RND family efflux transporter MFP subunit
MKQYLLIPAIFMGLLSSCGNSKEGNKILNEKRATLEKLKAEKSKLDDQVASLEKEISQLDTAATTSPKLKLVAIQTIQTADFAHFIQLEGHVDAENVSYITPRGGPGQIKEIYVHQGEQVRKGQLLLKLDDAIQRQSLNTARQGLESIKTQLDYARTIYQRQKNLWDQNIGTEVQLITAKNNVVALENQLKTTQESIKVNEEQMRLCQVTSDVSGIADIVTIKLGEMFGAPTPGAGVIKIVNTSLLKATSNIPENYIGSVSKNTPVIVQLPDANKSINTYFESSFKVIKC